MEDILVGDCRNTGGGSRGVRADKPVQILGNETIIEQRRMGFISRTDIKGEGNSLFKGCIVFGRHREGDVWADVWLKACVEGSAKKRLK